MSQVVPIGMSDRRLPQAGRIRIGEKTKSRKGRTSIDTFKFTSHDADLLRPLADEYGGKVEVWNEPSSGDKYALVTKATKINVVLPPDPLSQHYELWDPQLKRRCNGIECTVLVGTPDDADFQTVDCICARKGELECSYKLRLNVLLAEVDSLGTWRLDTSSEHARKEMPAVVDAIERLQEHGFHKAVLRLEQRRAPGKVFNVPVLDPGVSIGTLIAGDTRLGQLPAAPHPAPVGELEAAVGDDVESRPPSSPAASSAAVCAGSNQPPAEMTILDTTPGVEPSGTCQVCGIYLPMDFYRLPPHSPLPGSDAHTPSSTRALDDDDEVIDAELVEEVDATIGRAWIDNLPATHRNAALVRARKIAREHGEPEPTTAAAIPDHIINQLAAEADT